jgi:hypothetical protein
MGVQCGHALQGKTGFDNRVLRGISGAKGDTVTRVWRKQHNEKFHNLYSFGNYYSNVSIKKNGRGMCHVWDRKAMRIKYWHESL